jgi:ribonuclease P protein component
LNSRRALDLPAFMNVTPDKVSEALPKRCRLRARAEFQTVYAEGRRYDGRLMAAFLRRNDSPEHRLGITASTKAIGKSVDRNRARRLLREIFRRSPMELARLKRRYDWVINAKRPLLSSSEELRFREFRRIVEQIARDEH